MRRRAIWLLGGVLLAALMPGSVLAASAVDQTNETHDVSDWVGVGTMAQTFTVGVTGKLTGVDLFLWDTDGASFAVGIQALDRKTKVPIGSALASGSQTVASEKWYHFSLSPQVSCSAGAQLGIVLYGDPNSAAYRSSANPYAGGQALKVVLGSWTPAGGDLAFRTYIDDAAAPTPTAGATPTPTAAATPIPTAAATPTPTAAATPTPKPAATPTPKPAATPSSDPTATETPTPELPSAPAASVATASATASPPAGDPAPTATVAASASADPSPGSNSSDPGGPPLPLVIAGIAGAGLLVGGLGFVFGRRRPKSA
jgi:hypothetical protein